MSRRAPHSRIRKPRRAPPKPTYTLHLISDATGTLARHVINAVLTQFPDLHVKQVYHVFQNRKDEVEKTIDTFRRRNHLVFFALLDPECKQLIHDTCIRMKIPHYDLTGSIVQFISDHTRTRPVNELARLHQTDEGYFHRIAAMDYTARHDDGRGLDTLDQADLVIVGLSRVSKSPSSIYLGAMGYKVANVSITRETGFPQELDRVRKKTVAFTIQPKLLQEIRHKRLKDYRDHMARENLVDLPYYNLRSVVEEVVYAETEYRKRGYPILDITHMTVEEIAANVLRLLGTRRKDLKYD
ncbi:MAG: pyruvate, phosphate dikinase/phosphoenolpyruvate synthase regulator [Kiritimatiellae bacterium]|nr:pyruvate, phosphate dikinase/phosphoenolpyruvate synthase regulator [Kiritimatiellia bacterium]